MIPHSLSAINTAMKRVSEDEKGESVQANQKIQFLEVAISASPKHTYVPLAIRLFI